MNLKETLEIILITYNRKKCLEETFKQIFARNSPIKKLDITVLDNCSTDGTGELVRQYILKYPNIKHICHNRNIGGNANIARAFEISSKKYVWVICDDDFFDFTCFDEVETAIEQSYDLIILNMEPAQASKLLGHENAKILHCLTFLPGAIIKTSNIGPFTMINAYDNIANWFPHLCVSGPIVSRGGKIKITSKNIVLYGGHIYDNLKFRDASHLIKGLSPMARNAFFYSAYLNTLEIIEDKKIRAEAVEYFRLRKSFFYSVVEEFKCNKIFLGNYLRNLFNP